MYFFNSVLLLLGWLGQGGHGIGRGLGQLQLVQSDLKGFGLTGLLLERFLKGLDFCFA